MLVRTALDNFQIGTADGFFQCLVHKPLGISLRDLRLQFATNTLPEKLLKLTLLHLLLALDYLHSEAGIIHTGTLPPFVYHHGFLKFFLDIQEKNIMLGIEDNSILVDFEAAEKSNPSPRKIVGDRVIHSSRKLKKTKQHGRPILCDFGQARFGLASYSGDIQPYIYRAPEVVLRMSWDQQVDIWNVGVMVRNASFGSLNLRWWLTMRSH
jgi:serine/threonine protein kinase